MESHITVKLFATLTPLTPENSDAYPVAEGTTVHDVIRQLSVPEEDAKLIFINGRKAEFDTPLKSGDRLGIFPPVGGG
jgi:molybdopterin converting factor small subunit